jgi:hypothetical protein
LLISALLPDQIDDDTGLILNLPGLSTYDGNPIEIRLENLQNDRNVIIATVAYRNLSFLRDHPKSTLRMIAP